MTPTWERIGRLFEPAVQRPWLRSHAALPLVLPLEHGPLRVLFAGRDEHNRSHVGSVELTLGAAPRVDRLSDEPVLAPGPLGHFDDHGVYPASVARHGDELWLYYIGWNPGARGALFYSSIGLAVSTDGGATFEKGGQAPLLARSEVDPCLVTSPCVVRDEGRWRMWYVSGVRWEDTPDEGPISYYHIKYADSDDGLSWRRDGHVCIDNRPGERNIARPCVIRDEDRYRMWYSTRDAGGYTLGYAESPDGLAWERLDKDASPPGPAEAWDSEAFAYPWVFDAEGARWMLFNGNGYGRTGFGLARQLAT